MNRPRAILLEAVSTGEQADPEQASLPEQDFRLHEVGETRNWDIVDIILIPGFSRVFYTYREFAEAALEVGIDAPMRMFDHWAKQDFDVFAVSSGDRFGREQSIFAEVVGRTIDANATVFTLRDGDIHQGNRRMFVSMVGYQASVEIDELVRRRRSGMKKRAKQGLPTSSGGLIVSHKVIEGGDGKEYTVINEDARRLFSDIAELLLAGESWRAVADAVAERGHRSSKGKRWASGTLAGWLMHPTLWGNSAQQFSDAKKYSRARGFWVFDATEPAPSYVIIHYGTHEPFFTGLRGEHIKAELRRRFGVNGKPHPTYRGKFAGLVVCDECGYAACYKRTKYYTSLHCISDDNPNLRTGCTNRYMVNEKKLVRHVDALLRDLLNDDWTPLSSHDNRAGDAEARLASLASEIADTRKRVSRMIDKQSFMPDVLADTYDIQIRALGETLDALQREQKRLEQIAQDASPKPPQLLALKEIRELGLEAFWGQSDAKINQWLTRIMGNRRFVIAGGDVIGVTSRPRRYHAKPTPSRD